MNVQQRDFLIEAEDARRVTSVAMADVVAALPASTTITPGDMARALNLTEETVRGYIQCGLLRAWRSPVKKTDGKSIYKIPRAEALDFIKRNLTA